ncbi:MAG: hypothetical protein KTR31_20255 [Myxococcales bacterium]|nr:hypothetical protein [Myxococcales bacterium]
MWFLAALPALAAPCEREIPMDAWRWQIRQAEELLSGANVRRGQATAKLAAERALCIAEVATPADVTRLARVQAISAFYEQDTDQMEQWALTAIATEPSTAWPDWAMGFHPSRDLIDQVVPTPWAGWPDGQVFLHRRGSVFLNGRWLDVAIFPTGASNLVQVFDSSGKRVDAWWQHGSAPPEGVQITNEAEAPKAPKFLPRVQAISEVAG